MNDDNKIIVLIIKTGKTPKVKAIEYNIKSMQEIVGGTTTSFMPFKDDVTIVCNDEGKINGMPLNRAICDNNNEIIDVVAGDFFMCRSPSNSESFQSLSEEQIKKYKKMFQYPENFVISNKGIKVIKVIPKGKERER